MSGTRPARPYTYAVGIPAYVTMGPDGKVVRIDLCADEILNEIPRTDAVTIGVDDDLHDIDPDAETREVDRAAIEEYLDDHVQTVWDNPATLLRVGLRDGVVSPLTPCCGADGTGIETDTGVACRACHDEVEPVFGETAEPRAAVDRITEWLQDVAPDLTRDAAARHARSMWRDALIAYATGHGLDLRADAMSWYGQWGWLIDLTDAWVWISERLAR